MRTFDDFTVGLSETYGPVEVTRDDIVAFAKAYDPQPFHLDEEAAKGTFVGTLIASGWHTCAVNMRLIADGFLLKAAAMGAPGIEEVKWLWPVHPGANLRSRMTVLEARPSRSRPEVGLVQFRFDVLDDADDVVLFQRNWIMSRHRGAAFDGGGKPRLPASAARPPAEAAALPAGRGFYLEDLVPGEVTELDGEVHGGRHRRLREKIRTAAVPRRSRRGRKEPLRRPLRFRLAHGRGVDEADECPPGPRAAPRRPAPGRAPRIFGPSPGFRNLVWAKPVYAGDTIRYRSTIAGTRASASRPGWGLAFHRNNGVNQNGDEVLSFDGAGRSGSAGLRPQRDRDSRPARPSRLAGAMPRSVTSPVTSRAGVTSKAVFAAGLPCADLRPSRWRRPPSAPVMCVTSSAGALLDRDLAHAVVEPPVDGRERAARRRTARRCPAQRAPSGRCRSCWRRRRCAWCGRCRRCTRSTLPCCIRWPPALSAIDRVRHAVLAELPGGEAAPWLRGRVSSTQTCTGMPGVVRLVDRRERRAPVDGGEPAGIAMGQHVDGRRPLRAARLRSARAVLADRLAARDVLVGDRGGLARRPPRALRRRAGRRSPRMRSSAQRRLTAVGRVGRGARKRPQARVARRRRAARAPSRRPRSRRSAARRAPPWSRSPPPPRRASRGAHDESVRQPRLVDDLDGKAVGGDPDGAVVAAVDVHGREPTRLCAGSDGPVGDRPPAALMRRAGGRTKVPPVCP